MEEAVWDYLAHHVQKDDKKDYEMLLQAAGSV